MSHRVETMSFRRGIVDCTCGEQVKQAGSPEVLAAAYSDHRRIAAGHLTSADAGRLGAAAKHAREREYKTALGTSSLTASQRGQMGADSKRAKRAERDRGLAPG